MHKWNSCCLQNLGFRTQDNPDIPPLQLAAYDGTIQVSSQNKKTPPPTIPKISHFGSHVWSQLLCFNRLRAQGKNKNGGVSKGGTKLRASFSPRLFGENQCIKTQIYHNFCQSIVRSKVGNFWAINGQSWVRSAPVMIRSWAECKKSSCLPLHPKLNTSLTSLKCHVCTCIRPNVPSTKIAIQPAE